MAHLQDLHIKRRVKGIAYADSDQLYLRQPEDASQSGVSAPLNRHYAEAMDEQAWRVHSVLPSILACPTMDRNSA